MVLSFNDKYNLLKEYLMKNSGKYPQRKAIYKDFNVYNWLKELKKIYFEGERDSLGNITYIEENLSKEEIDMLDRLGFPWGINSSVTFKKNLYLLKEYIKKNNEYPKYKVHYEGVNLYAWVNIIRTTVQYGKKLPDGSFKNLKKEFILTKEQYDKLLDMDFVFEGVKIKEGHKKERKEPSDEFFNDNYELLVEYVNKFGRFPTSTTFYNNKNLGYFISKIRCIVKFGETLENGDIIYKTSKLTKEDIDKLDDINFPYLSETNIEKWFNHYNKLVEYLEFHNGKYPIGELSYKYDFLRTWMCNQRTLFNNGEEQKNGSIKRNYNVLYKEQIDLLNDINFPWVVNKTLYLNKTIETTEDMINKRRYLINELLKLKDIEFNHRVEQDYIIKKYVKSIYEK